MKKCIFLSLFIFSFVLIYSQVNQIEYYLSKIKTATTDTAKLKYYSELTELCETEDIPIYANESIKIADQLLSDKTNSVIQFFSLKYKLKSLNNLAYYYYYKNQFIKALEIWDNCQSKYDSLIKLYPSDTLLLKDFIYVLNNIASSYETIENNQKSINLYYRVLSLSEKIKDDKLTAMALNNLGYNYRKIEQYDKSIKFYRLSLHLKEKIQDTSGIVLIYNNIANVYLLQNNFTKALNYLIMANKLSDNLNDIELQSSIYTNLGKLYMDIKDFNNAFKYLRKALTLYNSSDKEIETGVIYYNLANIFIEQYKLSTKKSNYIKKMYSDSAFKYLRKSESIGIKYKDLNILASTYQLLVLNYEILNDYRKQIYYHLKYDSLEKIINLNELNMKAYQDQIQYEYDKILSKKQNEFNANLLLEKEKNEKQKIILISSIIAVITLIVFVFFIYKYLLELKQKNIIILNQKTEVETQKQIIEKKQKDIIESIQYSQIIQKSILPHRRDIWRTLPQSFVLYKPKDIVAGDFYWFHIIKDYCLIAVADCTGHGIPGAFMSILCNDKLNEAINYTHQIDEILYFTNLNIKRTLKQLDNTSTSKDGMDIILVKIPYERVQKRETPIPIEFAGANRPLFLFRNHKQTTEVFKTTKASIGGFTDTEQTFQKYSLDLYTDDVIYLTSDGYIDQFGGSKNKKLMTTGFVNLINQIGNLHYQKQKQELETFFNEWKGINEQIDDVCIIGIKI